MTFADAAVQVGSGSAATTSYLDADAVLEAARATGADCIHPVRIAASQNTLLWRVDGVWGGRVDGVTGDRGRYAATAREKREIENKKTNAGLRLPLRERGLRAALRRGGHYSSDPPAAAIDAMGDKVESKRIAEAAGVSVIPGFNGVVESAEFARRVEDIGGLDLRLPDRAVDRSIARQDPSDRNRTSRERPHRSLGTIEDARTRRKRARSPRRSTQVGPDQGAAAARACASRATRARSPSAALATDEAKKSFGDDAARREATSRTRATSRSSSWRRARQRGRFPERDYSSNVATRRSWKRPVALRPSKAGVAPRFRMQAEASQLATAVGYTSAGTVEIIVDATTADFSSSR